jgi:hypothetical protein
LLPVNKAAAKSMASFIFVVLLEGEPVKVAGVI